MTDRRCSILFVFIVAALQPLPAAGQTTPTEIAAASEVLNKIEALQERLQPTEQARSIVARRDQDRQTIMDRTSHHWDTRFEALSDWIGLNPEVGWEEHLAVDTLTSILRQAGWKVDIGVADLETAWVASWDSPAGGDGIILGLIGEYDALRDTEGAFHGDQHNSQSPAALSAAFALREYMETAGVPGGLRIYGTPAEEVGPPAKTIMFDAGVFDEASILVRSHSAVQTSRARAGFGVCCLNINEVKYTFLGKASHQLASWHGRNALEAAVMFYTAVDRLRSTFRPEASIQGVIPEGGVAPNVVPARAVVDYYIRYPDEVYLEHISDMMDNAARGSAMATGTRVEINRYGEYRDGISLGTLEELAFAYSVSEGAEEINPTPGRPTGYEETGWVTRKIPGVGVSVSSSRGAYHTRAMLADATSEYGHNAFEKNSRIMAAILYDFLTDETFRNAVREEHSVLQGLLGDYHESLREVYAPELTPQNPPKPDAHPDLDGTPS